MFPVIFEVLNTDSRREAWHLPRCSTNPSLLGDVRGRRAFSFWFQTISNLRDCCESRECLFEIVQNQIFAYKISQYKGKSLHLVLRREYWAMGALILLRWCRIHYGTHRSRVLRVAGALTVWSWWVNHPNSLQFRLRNHSQAKLW